MKKLAAISLLLLFAFNLIGYQYLYTFLAKNADAKLEQRIDNNEYDEAQLIEIRINLNMPYQERYTNFERHYGKITIDGNLYTYVKQKIEGNVLVLKCINNFSRQHLRKTFDEITKANNGQDNNSQSQNSAFLKIIKPDYYKVNSFDFPDCSLVSVKTNPVPFSKSLPEVYILPLQQPPRC